MPLGKTPGLSYTERKAARRGLAWREDMARKARFGQKRGFGMEQLRQRKGFFIDMDGVIYHGNRLLPGVKEFVQWLYDEVDEDNCGCCDNCLYPKKEFEGKEYILDALTLVSEIKEKFKIEHLVNILIGEADSAIKAYKHDKLEMFGSGAEKSRQFWTMVFRRALISRFIEKDIEQYGATGSALVFLKNLK